MTVESIDESGLGKFWRVKNWRMPLCSFIIVILIIMFTARARRFNSYSYVSTAIRREKILCTCICTYIVANWHRQKSATPFLSTSRTCASMHGEGHVHVISHRSKLSVSLPRVPVWWYTYSQLRGYHYIAIISSLTIDSVRAPLTDAQGLIACSISARAYCKR